MTCPTRSFKLLYMAHADMDMFISYGIDLILPSLVKISLVIVSRTTTVKIISTNSVVCRCVSFKLGIQTCCYSSEAFVHILLNHCFKENFMH